MIQFFTIVDVTNGELDSRADAGSYNPKVHCFDNEPAAKCRRTRLANLHPGRDFAVFVTVIRSHGAIASEWITPVTFDIPAG